MCILLKANRLERFVSELSENRYTRCALNKHMAMEQAIDEAAGTAKCNLVVVDRGVCVTSSVVSLKLCAG